ncbi:hypothetical protein OROGR_015755 [Orobanche gracilis]
MATDKQVVLSLKRPRLEIESGTTSIDSTRHAIVLHEHQVTTPNEEMPDAPRTELLLSEFERLSLSIDPGYVSKLVDANIIGYARLPAQLFPVIRYYTINIHVFRSAIQDLVSCFLRTKLYESQSMSFTPAEAEVTRMAHFITDACMTALYAKLHTIHTSYQRYSTRFAARPSYTNDVELPLPLADAIDNFGIFTPLGTETHYLCAPLYPENTLDEGHSTQEWSSHEYEAYSKYLEILEIPVKSVDTCQKFGSSWWTYKAEYADDHFNLRCIFPPINYSDHSALTASMFLSIDENRAVQQIIHPLVDDAEYPVRFREIPDGYQLKAFSALYHGPSDEWN